MSPFVEIPESSGRLYCIGDIHGCANELDILLQYLVDKEKISNDDLVVCLGDYVDRGPDSKNVVNILLEFREKFPKTRFLKGNHEDMMMNYLGYDGLNGHMYLFNGGIQTFRSYGLSTVDAPDATLKRFPQKHLEFFETLDSGIIVGKYILVHAGVDPSVPLEVQSLRDLFWIRDDFIEATHSFEKTVIFGHTVYSEVFYDLPYKMGIDTGLVYGNRLTCVELKNSKILEIERGGAFVLESPFAA